MTIRSGPGRNASSSGGLYGIGVFGVAIRHASSRWPSACSATHASTSPAQPPVSGPSSTTTTRFVLHTDAITVSTSIGRSVRRSITSTFGQYKRTSSFFERRFAGFGEYPRLGGRAVEPFGDETAAEVFQEGLHQSGRGRSGAIRDNLREALRLLKAAGYEIRDQVLTNVKTGEPFTVELLSNVPLFERVFLIYKPSLERLGIEVTVRTVDEPQYENRLRNWDFRVQITQGVLKARWKALVLPIPSLTDCAPYAPFVLLTLRRLAVAST